MELCALDAGVYEWVDSDQSSAFCMYPGIWMSGMTKDVCEQNYNLGECGCNDYDMSIDEFCCGDDENEVFSLYRRLEGSLISDPTDKACCITDKCVYDGECYTPGSLYTVSFWEPNKKLFCYDNGVSPSYWANPDETRAYCEAGNYHWNVGGDASFDVDYYSSSALPRPDYCSNILSGEQSKSCCCGDDTGELYRICASKVDSCTGDDACCDDTDCVYNSQCYTKGAAYAIALQPDKKTVCAEKQFVGIYWWDCDTTDLAQPATCEGICGYKYIASGEITGEYTAASQNGCCGDDNNEFVTNCVSKTGTSCTGTACCSASTDCVYNGACFTQSTALQIGLQSNEVTACFPEPYVGKGAWYDCDTSQDNGISLQPNLCNNVCGKKWVKSGEIVGEYTAEGQDGCCEDDAGEHYVCTGSYCACCKSTDAIINAAGQCTYCKGTGEVCTGAVGTQGDCCSGMYCTIGGICCLNGEHYDPDALGGCSETNPCYPKPPGECGYEPSDSEWWLPINNCVSNLVDPPYLYACCPVNVGIPSYDFTKVTTY